MDSSFDVFNLRDPISDGIPENCEFCGGELVYSGLGEYTCKDCHKISRDNYGKVRHYVEKHPGATAIEVSAATGVSKSTIKRLLQEDRIQVMPYSRGDTDGI